ncbi:MAG: Ycf66 family protein [Vulcanococcus sp.]
MLASLSGSLALALGLALMLLPLLSPELSRPRDAAWGAVVLVLGLTLATSADRLTGAPMLAVLCAGLLIGRLGGEVAQLRWRQLTPEEQLRLSSLERWQTSVRELTASLNRGAGALSESLASLKAALQRGSGSGKRWVRPDPADTASEASSSGSDPDPATVVVSSFAEIDALIEAASGEAG